MNGTGRGHLRQANHRSQRTVDEHGSAMVEFLGVSLILLIPLVYLVVTIGRVQAGAFAAESAAREAVRAMATAESVAMGASRANAAVGIALKDQGFGRTDGVLNLECSSHPCLTPGGSIGAVMRVNVPLPWIPGAVRDEVPLFIPIEAVHTGTFGEFLEARP